MFKKTLIIVSTLLALSGCKHFVGESSYDSNTGGHHGEHMNVTPGTQGDLEVNVGDRVLFGYDSSALDQEAQNTLDRQADWFKRYADTKITIEGHCDERGTREYNLALGERRANAAKKYLVAAGIDSSRISVISYGKERPAVMGANEEIWAQNRRAVSIVVN